MTIYYESELYHHGVKGMKWGVRRERSTGGDRMSWSQRRAAKKQLKADYKQAKVDAKNKYKATTKSANATYNKKASKAEEEFDRDTAPAAKKRDVALATQKQMYDALSKQTDSYYKNEMDRHMNKATKYDNDAEWWGRESNFGREAAKKSDEYLNEAVKAEQRYNDAKSRNAYDNDSKTIEINATYDHETRAASERYADALNKASAQRRNAYSIAGAQYLKNKKNAKLNYKQAKKDLKRKR